MYDPNPTSWMQQKTSCRHGAFMDGVDLFDAKFFGMSARDATYTDPHCRKILEVGYEALSLDMQVNPRFLAPSCTQQSRRVQQPRYHMGCTRNTLRNSDGAVYVGGGNTEAAFVALDQAQASQMTTGLARAKNELRC